MTLARAARPLLRQPVLLLAVALFLAVLPARPEMASGAFLQVLTSSATLLLVLAIGQTLVLLTAGIDLSLPAVISLASVAGASLVAPGGWLAGSFVGVPAAVAGMLLVGVLVGTLQGLAVARLRMPAFLVSLATLTLVSGLAVWSTRSERVPVPESFTRIWYGSVLGVPAPLLVVVVLAVGADLLLRRTVVGRRLYAVGHNPQAALIAGVPVSSTLVFAYAASGLCAGIAAVFYTARLHTGSPTLVENEVLLDCIGAAVIGGTSLFGGRGRIPGTVLGAVFIALVGSSLNMLGLRYWHVITVKGLVILLAALLDALRVRLQAAAQEA